MKKVTQLLEQEKYIAQYQAKKQRDLSLDDAKVYTLATEIIKETKRALSDKAFQLCETAEEKVFIDLALSKPLTLLCNPRYLKLHLAEIIKGKAEPQPPLISEESGSDSEESGIESGESSSESETEGFDELESS